MTFVRRSIAFSRFAFESVSRSIRAGSYVDPQRSFCPNRVEKIPPTAPKTLEKTLSRNFSKPPESEIAPSISRIAPIRPPIFPAASPNRFVTCATVDPRFWIEKSLAVPSCETTEESSASLLIVLSIDLSRVVFASFAFCFACWSAFFFSAFSESVTAFSYSSCAFFSSSTVTL